MIKSFMARWHDSFFNNAVSDVKNKSIRLANHRHKAAAENTNMHNIIRAIKDRWGKLDGHSSHLVAS